MNKIEDKNNLLWCIVSLREKLYSLNIKAEDVDGNQDTDKLSSENLFVEYTAIFIMLCILDWYEHEKKPNIPLHYKKPNTSDFQHANNKEFISNKVQALLNVIKDIVQDRFKLNELAAIIAYCYINDKELVTDEDSGEEDGKMNMQKVKEVIKEFNSKETDKDITELFIKTLYNSKKCAFAKKNKKEIIDSLLDNLKKIQKNNSHYLIIPKERKEDFDKVAKKYGKLLYIWRTQLNCKVREYHHCLEGMVFTYDIEAKNDNTVQQLRYEANSDDANNDEDAFRTSLDQDNKIFTLHKAGNKFYSCQCTVDKYNT